MKRKLYIVYGQDTVGNLPGEWFDYLTFPVEATDNQIAEWCTAHQKGYTRHEYLHEVEAE